MTRTKRLSDEEAEEDDGRDLCEHGHDLDCHHPCIECAVERADELGDMQKEGML
jgi:hypothetical protein